MEQRVAPAAVAAALKAQPAAARVEWPEGPPAVRPVVPQAEQGAASQAEQPVVTPAGLREGALEVSEEEEEEEAAAAEPREGEPGEARHAVKRAPTPSS